MEIISKPKERFINANHFIPWMFNICILTYTVKPVLRDHCAKRSPSDLRPLLYVPNSVL